MNKLYIALTVLALLFIGDLTRAHFDKRVHHEIYFSLFDRDGSERELRREISKKRIKRNWEKKNHELSVNAE